MYTFTHTHAHIDPAVYTHTGIDASNSHQKTQEEHIYVYTNTHSNTCIDPAAYTHTCV